MQDLPKAYDPLSVEKKCYLLWEKLKLFSADSKSKKEPFCIILPPPNVTGVLHMGHALVDTVQDILIRYKKMSGYEAFWVPGLDHAGISTQTVVERHLIATQGKRRVDYDRETFLKHVWDFKEATQEKILSQLKALGCALDWDRLRFTMDDQANLSVKMIFKKMYDDGLIYQGDYLVNWDPVTQTALADDEVEYEEKDSCMWYFRYPIDGSDEHVVIATTRPETMLGDTAVAIAPDDGRYQHLIGKFILLPITNRKIPIVEDGYVDKSFKTGVVKITPAHDFNDYELALRHNLPMINIMHMDGTLNEEAGAYQGMSMLKAREAIVKQMQSLGLVEKIEPYKHRVGVSYRSKAVIEPFLSKQWFVKITKFKQLLIDTVKNEEIKLIPKHWEKTYFHWIENLRDWCISRQLWWGHRIPIWHHKTDPNKKICFAGEGLPDEVKQNPENWEQDPGVLDTWFSSSLWPFSALGWPETDLIKKFYPTSVLVTGYDILFFWVARMILMGKYVMKDIPFKQTFIHGLIFGKSYWRNLGDGSIEYVSKDERLDFELGKDLPQDVQSKWEKMSKSKGNVIDPMEIIDTYGADAMRMTLCFSLTHSRQIDLDRRRFEEFKNFANKIWNAFRFIMMQIQDLSSDDLHINLDEALFTLDDKWLISRLQKATQEISQALEGYHFDVYAKTLYTFFWDEFCAYYLETCKPYMFGKIGNQQTILNKKKILICILVHFIRLMHPVAPFMSEELFQQIKKAFPNTYFSNAKGLIKDTLKTLNHDSILQSSFPKYESDYLNEKAIKEFSILQEALYTIRNIRAEMSLSPSQEVDLYFIGKTSKNLTLIKNNISVLKALVRVASIHFAEQYKDDRFSSNSNCKDFTIYIPLPEILIEKERLRLEKEKEKLLNQINGAENKLSNQNFVDRAPESLVSTTKQKLKDDQVLLEQIQSKLLLITKINKLT